jgi:hypothetical protein
VLTTANNTMPVRQFHSEVADPAIGDGHRLGGGRQDVVCTEAGPIDQQAQSGWHSRLQAVSEMRTFLCKRLRQTSSIQAHILFKGLAQGFS